MKTLFSFLLLSALSVSAQIVTINGSASLSGLTTIGAATSAAPSYLYQQDFEAGAEPANWTHSGIVNYNYATAPAPLVGSFSLGLAASSTADFNYGTPLNSDVYGYFVWSDSSLNDALLYVTDGSGTTAFYIDQGGGHVRINCGAANAFTATTFAAGAVVHIWYHYSPGALIEVWVSTTTTKPPSSGNDYATTTITGSTACQHFKPIAPASGESIFDHFIISSTSIGSNP